MPVTRQLLERGQERFNIYCAVCHGPTGEGNGMIVQRGFPQPPSFHEQRLRDAPPGREGASTSALQLSDVLGTALGTGVGGALIAAGERTGAEAWIGLAAVFGLCVAIAAFGFLASWRLTPARRVASATTAAEAA